MDSNNMITPDQEPSSRQSALKKKVSRKYVPAHLAHACFPHAKKLSLKKL